MRRRIVWIRKIRAKQTRKRKSPRKAQGRKNCLSDTRTGGRLQKAHIVLFLVGLVVPILISAVTAFSSAGERSLDHPGAGQYILFLVLGIVLFAIGVVVAYFFVKYERGKEKTEKL